MRLSSGRPQADRHVIFDVLLIVEILGDDTSKQNPRARVLHTRSKVGIVSNALKWSPDGFPIGLCCHHCPITSNRRILPNPSLGRLFGIAM